MPFCSVCSLTVDSKQWIGHLRSRKHKQHTDNVISLGQGIEKVNSAFRNRLATYRITARDESEQLSLSVFFDNLRDKVKSLIDQSLAIHNCIKVNFEVYLLFLMIKNSTQEVKSFGTKNITICFNYDFTNLFSDIVSNLMKKVSEFEQRDSGWTLLSNSHIEININKYQPLRGSMYIDLPQSIKTKKACVNIRNEDMFCFLWSVTAALYPVSKNVQRVSSYPHCSNLFNIDGMDFPVTFSDISMFEKNNANIRINVYGLENGKQITGPLYKSQYSKRNRKTVNLLLLEKDKCSHYCLIKDLSRLVRNQITKHHGKLFFCDECLLFFRSNDDIDSHICAGVMTQLPRKGSVIEFKNYDRKQNVPFVIYADFETMLVPVQGCEADPGIASTADRQVHVPIAFAYYIVCSFDPSRNRLVSYRGTDCVDKFVKSIYHDVHWINSQLSNNVPIIFNKEDAVDFKMTTRCHICQNLLFNDRVRDHCHLTGRYRGAAHNYCNLMFKLPKFIPIFFHNLSGYDCHLFITKLGEAHGALKIIAKNKESYVSFTKFIQVSTNECVQLRFVDSFKFLSTSLDKLAKNMTPSQFEHLRNFFPCSKQFKLLTRKGVYPYDYMNCIERYAEKNLPSVDDFYNSLNNENISSSDYQHAQLVWSEFKIKNLGEYTDLYLKTDVLLLTDIFENFRNTSKLHYQLDPAFYVTAPSLSFDAMLLKTGIKLELIDDLAIIRMIQDGIRGGICMCSHRYAKSNNKYMEHFDPRKDEVFIVYVDCNNLYGYAMCQPLPLSDFRFLNQKEIENLQITDVKDDADHGYILEVDLIYPKHLHSTHNDLPFCPEKCIPPGGKTSKLIPNLYDKYKYVIHYVHLKNCIKHGLILKKIHRVITFRQKAFLKKYIDLNTELRQKALSTFEQDFFKLLNNSIFGKTLENSENRVNVQLVNQWSDYDNKTKKKLSADSLIARPNFHSASIFSENLVAIQMKPEKIVLDKPIYIGFSVLELSKKHMYDFHYSIIQPHYRDLVKLCYTDTDSFIYKIHTSDFYYDLQKHFLAYFDTSNYSPSNPYNLSLLNKKVPGLFKDEMGGKIINEFVGLRPKLYCIQSEKVTLKKAKGVKKCVVRDINKSDYEKTLISGELIRKQNLLFKSLKHEILTRSVNKVVLSSNDDKRLISKNSIETVAWGNCSILC